jgi:alkylation response protein AidB-like acyl-CoA dehydrogenase
MHFHWTQDQVTIRNIFSQIGIATRGYEISGGNEEFDRATWNQVLEAGLWRMIIPECYGGQGRYWWDFTAALEGLATSVTSPGILLSIIAQAGMVRALDNYGSDEQRRTYFRKILNGEISATAIAEPDTGTDVRATLTTISPVADNTFVLNGAKYNIAHAQIASFILVVCKLNDKKRDGISLVIIDPDSKGVLVGPKDEKLGNSDLPTGKISFNQVTVEPGDLLGEPGEGLRNLVDIVSLGRLYYGLTAGLILAPMLDEAFEFAQLRETFNVPIIEHQHVQRRLTDIRMGMEKSKWLSYAALDRLLTGSPDAVMLCSIAKIVGAETVVNGALDLVKLYGSKGYHEGRITRFLKDALAYCSVGGTEEMHRKNIMGQMVRLAALSNRDPGRHEKPAIRLTA